MAKIFTSEEFVRRLKDCAENHSTRYENGTIGQYKSDNRFHFDCICLIKSILWGWNGNKKATYGGATYASNGVPDQTLDWFLNQCSEVSTDFSKIEVGEYLWMEGHCGIYIGNGLAVECTPKWYNNVQYTAVGNIGSKSGYNTRTWKKHGKLPYIDYPTKPTIAELEKEIDGLENQIEELHKEILELKTTINELEKLNVEANEKVVELTKQLKQSEKEKQEVIKQLENTTCEYEELFHIGKLYFCTKN